MTNGIQAARPKNCTYSLDEWSSEFSNWCASVKAHATTTHGIDVVTVDLREKALNSKQVKDVVGFLNALPDEAKRKVLVLTNLDE